ncbi:MAG: methyltransferase domain-containing protein [Caldilineales bacterium]|nr:methyltransferase domain-containing protein [Caldilineales bacterium]
MNEIVRQRLLQINQEFYNQHAASFAATRFGAQPGWERIIAHFPAGCQVLDLGCGNGRFSRFLDSRQIEARYWGIDGSAQLIEIAQQNIAILSHVVASFAVRDLANPGWEEDLGEFDVVVAFAVLHHIPGFSARTAFLRSAACLSSAGTLIISNWRFTHSERMRRKILPWETVGLTDGDVEPGDYLLDWKGSSETGHRYAHQLDEDEVGELAAMAGFDVVEQFYADGQEGDLSLYSILVRKMDGD